MHDGRFGQMGYTTCHLINNTRFSQGTTDDQYGCHRDHRWMAKTLESLIWINETCQDSTHQGKHGDEVIAPTAPDEGDQGQ